MSCCGWVYQKKFCHFRGPFLVIVTFSAVIVTFLRGIVTFQVMIVTFSEFIVTFAFFPYTKSPKGSNHPLGLLTIIV